ncbi:MAG: hypothetical protein U9R68_00080, partial [Planctomycetota bacterium]|nr:hypothetical protein [Planctomycetota bacterium]
MNRTLHAAAAVVASLLSSAAVAPAAEPPWPMPDWPEAEPADVRMDARALARARACALTGGGSGMVTRHGRAVLRWGDR